MKVGWIGLGGIGTGMVVRALGAGHDVAVHPRGDGLAEAGAAGATVARNHAAVAAGCDILGICVFSDDQLRAALFDNGALAAMPAGSVVAIHTTGSPDLARAIGAAAPAGVTVLDATFSGGPAEARAGTLALMVGGEAAALAHARPLLATYADRIHHVGPLGQGQTLKLVNNLLFAANLRSAMEAVRLAQGQGLDRAACVAILQDCSGASFAAGLLRHMSIDQLMTVSRGYLQKDVAAALASAAAAGLDTAAFAALARYYDGIEPRAPTGADREEGGLR